MMYNLGKENGKVAANLDYLALQATILNMTSTFITRTEVNTQLSGFDARITAFGNTITNLSTIIVTQLLNITSAVDLKISNAIQQQASITSTQLNLLSLTLYANLGAFNTTMNQEIIRAVSAESTLSAKIDNETVSRLNTSMQLTSNITAEATARANTDTLLASNIATEATIRASIDTILASNITTEATSRANTDTLLASNIATEATIRASTDTILASNITSEAISRTSNVTFILNSYQKRILGSCGTAIAVINMDGSASCQDQTFITTNFASINASLNLAVNVSLAAIQASIVALNSSIINETNVRTAQDIILQQTINSVNDSVVHVSIGYSGLLELFPATSCAYISLYYASTIPIGTARFVYVQSTAGLQTYVYGICDFNAGKITSVISCPRQSSVVGTVVINNQDLCYNAVENGGFHYVFNLATQVDSVKHYTDPFWTTGFVCVCFFFVLVGIAL